MDENKIIEFLKENLRINITCEKRKLDWGTGENQLKVSLELINYDGDNTIIDESYIRKDDIDYIVRER
jgi:hypothetical protein